MSLVKRVERCRFEPCPIHSFHQGCFSCSKEILFIYYCSFLWVWGDTGIGGVNECCHLCPYGFQYTCIWLELGLGVWTKCKNLYFIFWMPWGLNLSRNPVMFIKVALL